MCRFACVMWVHPFGTCRAPFLHASRAVTWLTVYRAPQVSNSDAGVISLQFGACNRMAWAQFFQNCSKSMYSFGTGIRYPDSPLKKLQDSAGLISRCSLTTIFLFPKENDTCPGFGNFRVFPKIARNPCVRLEQEYASRIAL